MKQYILFFDIDGTLLDVPHGQYKPSDELKNAIKELQLNGHLCFIATGRTFAYLNSDILDLNFDGFITCNGAVVLKDDDVILSHYFPKELSTEIVNYFKSQNQSYTLCGPKKAHTEPQFSDIFDEWERFHVPTANVSTNTNLDEIDVAKFEVTTKSDEVAMYIRNLKNKGLEIVEYNGMKIFEFNMPYVTKGKAIIELLNLLNIPISQSIAFGDGNNDVEMLKTVGYGVAMGNGSEAAKAAADKVTETCANNGIVKELQRLGLIGG